MPLDRATFLAAALAPLGRRDPFAMIEAQHGGTIGVVAFEVGGVRRIAHRPDEPFPMASTWKLPLVMSVLARIDAGRDRLDRSLRFRTADLEPPYSAIAERYPHGGSLTVGEICRLTISESDNSGADLLAAVVGGPGAVTAYLRSIGVHGIRVDRRERSLPSFALRAEPRDTTTPSAMATLAARLAGDSPLSPRSTALLLRWMRATKTGDRRLRAGVPRGWQVADKTGTYANVANDVGLLYPPSGPPIAIACCTIDVHGYAGNRAIAEAAAVAARTLHPG
jgi:beta-lactamase class A